MSRNLHKPNRVEPTRIEPLKKAPVHETQYVTMIKDSQSMEIRKRSLRTQVWRENEKRVGRHMVESAARKSREEDRSIALQVTS
jgi:hypothetical protein